MRPAVHIVDLWGVFDAEVNSTGPKVERFLDEEEPRFTLFNRAGSNNGVHAHTFLHSVDLVLGIRFPTA